MSSRGWRSRDPPEGSDGGRFGGHLLVGLDGGRRIDAAGCRARTIAREIAYGSRGVERSREVGHEVVEILEPDRAAEQAGRDPGSGEGSIVELAMGRRR